MNFILYILCFLLGISLTLNILFIIFLRIKYHDCGNIFHFFNDDSIADKIAMKDFFNE